jgi:hypothetical protein
MNCNLLGGTEESRETHKEKVLGISAEIRTGKLNTSQKCYRFIHFLCDQMISAHAVTTKELLISIIFTCCALLRRVHKNNSG